MKPSHELHGLKQLNRPVLLLGVLLAGLPAFASAKPKETLPFSDARIRIEVNSTDGDSGLHVNLDAEGWRFVNIFSPAGKLIFSVEGGGSVKKTGLTEVFIESAEPGFEDLPLDQFLARFPEGNYRFTGETITGMKLASVAKLTHAIPAGPVLLSPLQDSVQDVDTMVVRWDPVADPAGSRITRYEVLVVEDGPVPNRVLSAVLPASQTSMIVPPTFLKRNGTYKCEVLAIEKGGNQTLSENAFSTAP